MSSKCPACLLMDCYCAITHSVLNYYCWFLRKRNVKHFKFTTDYQHITQHITHVAIFKMHTINAYVIVNSVSETFGEILTLNTFGNGVHSLNRQDNLAEIFFRYPEGIPVTPAV